MEDRRDPMLTYAMTVLAANKQARASGQRATFGRLDVRPNGTNAVPSVVTAWLDARAETSEHLEAMLADVERLAQDRAGRDGTGLTVTAESVSRAVHFDPDLTERIASPGGWPAGSSPVHHPTCTCGRCARTGSARRSTSRVTGATSPEPNIRNRRNCVTGLPSVHWEHRAG